VIQIQCREEEEFSTDSIQCTAGKDELQHCGAAAVLSSLVKEHVDLHFDTAVIS